MENLATSNLIFTISRVIVWVRAKIMNTSSETETSTHDFHSLPVWFSGGAFFLHICGSGFDPCCIFIFPFYLNLLFILNCDCRASCSYLPAEGRQAASRFISTNDVSRPFSSLCFCSVCNLSVSVSIYLKNSWTDFQFSKFKMGECNICISVSNLSINKKRPGSKCPPSKCLPFCQ
jgi:hypothetical protein